MDTGQLTPLLGPGMGPGHNSECLVARPLSMGSSQAQLGEATWEAPLWACRLQKGPKSLGALCVEWQPKAGTLVVQTPGCRSLLQKHRMSPLMGKEPELVD